MSDNGPPRNHYGALKVNLKTYVKRTKWRSTLSTNYKGFLYFLKVIQDFLNLKGFFYINTLRFQ